jgi:hypothetical protein
VPVQSVEVPVETKKAVAPKKKQTDDKKLDTKPVVPQEPVAQTTEPSDDKDENTNGETLLASLTEKISGLASQVKLIQTALKQLGKEFDKQKKIIDKKDGIQLFGTAYLHTLSMMEKANDKFNPFDYKLKGWSESVYNDIDKYYGVFGDIYEKYSGDNEMNPFVKLGGLMCWSALQFSYAKNKAEQINEQHIDIDDDPIMREKLREKALNETIKEAREREKENLNKAVNKDIKEGQNKMEDINFIKKHEEDYIALKKNNLNKESELNKLRQNLAVSDTNSIYNDNSKPTSVMANHQYVQQMALARKQKQLQEQRLKEQQYQQHLKEQILVEQSKNKQLQYLEEQLNYDKDMNELNDKSNYLIKLKEYSVKNGDLEEKSNRSQDSTKSSNSYTEYNADIKNILSDTRSENDLDTIKSNKSNKSTRSTKSNRSKGKKSTGDPDKEINIF